MPKVPAPGARLGTCWQACGTSCCDWNYVLAGVFNLRMTSFAASKIVCDRYRVPQCAGKVEAFEEYVGRTWDLYYGREGQESQVSTPIHLRSGLTGHAYEAVRKLEHSEQ